MDPNQSSQPNPNTADPLKAAGPQTITDLQPVIPSSPPPAPPMVMEDAAPDSESKASGLLRSLVGGLFSWFIVPIGIVLVLHFFVFQAFHVVGSSMIPTLKDSDYLIVSKLGQTAAGAKSVFGQKTPYIPARNQIIVFKYPKDPSLVFVKRVIGLPGEQVVIADGKVKVINKQHPNGFDPTIGYEVAAPYTQIDTDTIVPPGNVFVLGDNRTPNGSSDSREWGMLPSENIIGNAVARLIPIDKAQIF